MVAILSRPQCVKYVLVNPDFDISDLDWTVQYGYELTWKIIVAKITLTSKIPPFHSNIFS